MSRTLPMTDTHNVFDDQIGKTVPVVVEVAGNKRVIGDATLINTDEGVQVQMMLNTDDPDEAMDFLKGGLTSLTDYSIDASDYNEPDSQALFEFEAHDHKPVDHKDGKSPYCDICGLTQGFLRPSENFGFPKTY